MAKVSLPLFRGSYLYSSYLLFLHSLSLSYQRLKVQVLYLLFNTKMEYISIATIKPMSSETISFNSQ